MSLIAFGRTDKINAPTVANISAKRQNSVVRLPQLCLSVLSPTLEAKKSGELSVLMSGKIESPWRDLAQTIQDELETEVEASIENVDTFNSASPEKSCMTITIYQIALLVSTVITRLICIEMNTAGSSVLYHDSAILCSVSLSNFCFGFS